MKQLFMDSSTNMLYMAIGNDGVLVESTYRIGKKDHAKHVVDRIDQLLKRRDQSCQPHAWHDLFYQFGKLIQQGHRCFQLPCITYWLKNP